MRATRGWAVVGLAKMVAKSNHPYDDNHGYTIGRSPRGAVQVVDRATPSACRAASFVAAQRQLAAQIVYGLLLGVGKDVVDPSARLAPVGSAIGVAGPAPSPAAGRKSPGDAFVIQAPQGKLLDVVLALRIRAASRADCTAGNNSAIRMPMIVMTTNNSTRVNPGMGCRAAFATVRG